LVEEKVIDYNHSSVQILLSLMVMILNFQNWVIPCHENPFSAKNNITKHFWGIEPTHLKFS
jgi:hypothetical protein